MEHKKITVVDDAYYTAWCYPTKRLIHHQFHKYCYGDVFRTNLIKATEAFETYNCFKWLADDRNFSGALHQDDWEWGAVNFTPRAVEAGWKYYAMVLSEKAIAMMRQNQLVEYFASKGVRTQLFTKLEEAEEWIDSKGTLGIELSNF
jgi:hypothetical protein